jgi:intein/homing endonuclease
LGFCVDPNTRVLTADLNWVEIKNLNPGQEIVAVDEHVPGGRGKGRKMKTATVEVVGKVFRKAYRISFDDGRSVVCTAQHPWLSKKKMTDAKWRAIEPTSKTKGVLKIGTYVRWITKPWECSQLEDYWYGGILDGEGSIAKKNHSAGINAAQRDGDVLDRMIKYVDDRGYHYGIESKMYDNDQTRKPNHKVVIGRMDEMFRLIGQTRPSRFINNRFWEGRELPGKRNGNVGWSKIIKIEELGMQTMIDLQTSAKTYIAEGFVSHNTTFEAIDMLDDTLFSKNFSGLIINYERGEAINIFKEKIQFAWMNFPDELKSLYRLDSDQSGRLTFDFGDKTVSTIAVAVSGRGGSNNRIHLTELGKMAKKYPSDAEEFVSGTIPSVPLSGRIDIESTAEGQQGLFYKMFWEAWNRKREPFPTEFKAHFYNWTWDDDEISKVITIIPVEDMEQSKVFKEYQKKHELTDQQITFYYLKWLGVNKDWNKMHQEYPTCISGDTKVSTANGFIPIKNAEVDGKIILAKYNKGIQETFSVKTSLGYELRCTADHPILTENGFIKLKDIKDEKIILRGSEFKEGYKHVEFRELFTNCWVVIDERFSLFLGLFMGDGSFAGNKGTVSIACDGECLDVIDVVEKLFEELFSGSSKRICGSKNGCIEVRKSNKDLVKIFKNLGILRQNGSGNYKRNVCVPDYIKQSPKSVVKEFLRGLFEADGFADSNGNRVVFFSKYKDFIQDIQLLLLSFGITSRLRTAEKKSREYSYIGYDLSLRKEETAKFKKLIGFISSKKNDRLDIGTGVGKVNMLDSIVSVEKYKDEEVFDITTITKDFSAGGVVVHNCPDEAFVGSGHHMFDSGKIDNMLLRAKSGTVDDDWIFYEPYKEGHKYAAGVDVAQGVGQDSSTIVIMDFTEKTPIVVAEYESNKVPPDVLAYEIKRGCMKYGEAIAAVERNNHGHTTIATLKGIYPNLYTEIKEDKVSDTITEKLGWITSGTSKPKMLYELKQAIDQGEIEIPSKYILEELKAYDKEDISVTKFKPDQSRHWDRVMALAICYQMAVFAFDEEAEITDHPVEQF